MRQRPTFARRDLACFLDRCRGYLVAATPEEAVRQDVLDWLIDDLGVPRRRIRSEFSQKRRGGVGRADVIVLAPDATDHDGAVLMVVECKRPGAFLEDRTREQATRYAEHLSAPIIVVTNGSERRTYGVTEDGGWRRLDDAPTWEELLSTEYGEWTEEPAFMRWEWGDIASIEDAQSVAEQQNLTGRIVGVDSDVALTPFTLNLFGLLADGHDGPATPFRSGDVQIVEDLGQRSRNFANSAGGGWFSDYYRSFVTYEDGRAAHQVVSLAVIAQGKVNDHPLWGNNKGFTVLIAAVDDGPTSHAGLNMRLDDAFDPRARTRFVEVTHSGAMTTGKRGGTKRAVVMAELARHGSGELVRAGRVALGKLPLREELTWDNATNFVGNLIRYALVRDRIRETLR